VLVFGAPPRSFVRVHYHYRGPRKLGNRNRGLHVTTRGWSSSTASAATGAESYSNIVWCARSAGFAPSAALASASASATPPSPNPSPPNATLVLASPTPLRPSAASTLNHPRPRPAPVACRLRLSVRRAYARSQHRSAQPPWRASTRPPCRIWRRQCLCRTALGLTSSTWPCP
jgi:hypothetical protein